MAGRGLFGWSRQEIFFFPPDLCLVDLGEDDVTSTLLLPSKMDADNPTDALLVGLINAERVIDEAVEDFYNENARGDSAVIAVLDDDSDEPPFEHDAPSAPRCSGNKRSFPLFPQKPTLIAFVCAVEEESRFQAQAHDDVRTGKMREPTRRIEQTIPSIPSAYDSFVFP